MIGPGAPSLQHAPSTSEAYPPAPGAWCTCCWGTRWWTKRGAPYGWCCGTCHPPDHLAGALGAAAGGDGAAAVGL